MSPFAVLATVGALVTIAGCAGEHPTPDRVPPADSEGVSAAFPVLPDSLVLTSPGGATVWFSGARVGADSTGGTCVERGLVIVKGTERTLVPLLMTGEAPRLVNDSTARARLWLHCRPGDSYDVNLRSGTPSRVR